MPTLLDETDQKANDALAARLLTEALAAMNMARMALSDPTARDRLDEAIADAHAVRRSVQR